MTFIIILLLSFFSVSTQEVVESFKSTESHYVQLCKAFKSFKSSFETLDIKTLNGGLSSRCKFLCTVDAQQYVACFLTAPFSQRRSEIDAHTCAMEMGIAPALYYHDDECTIVIMDFLQGHTLLLQQAADRLLLDYLASAFRCMGQCKINLPYKDIFAHIRSCYDQLMHKECAISSMIVQAMKTVELLESNIVNEQKPLVFCHGDLNPRNIFFNGKLSLIDWEDAGLCYEMFDLADYSVFQCLDNNADKYLLSRYLQKDPTKKDMRYFEWMKLVVRIIDAFGTLLLVEDLKSISTKVNISDNQNFTYYETLFAEGSVSDSSEYLYRMATSELQEFFKNVDSALEYNQV